MRVRPTKSNAPLTLVAYTTKPPFVRKVRHPDWPEFATPEVTIHVDEFKRYETIISTTRTVRPQKTRKAPCLDGPTSYKIFLSSPALQVFAVQHSIDPAFLRFVLEEMVLPPDSDGASKEVLLHRASALKRAASDNQHSPPAARKFGCDFCNFEKWAEPKGYIEGGIIGFASNPFPFASHHDVHILHGPFHNLYEILVDSKYAKALVRAAFSRADQMLAEAPAEISGVTWGMSYGTG